METKKCMNGFRYRVVDENVSLEGKCLSSLMCLLTNCAEWIHFFLNGIERCIEEYGERERVWYDKYEWRFQYG